MRDRHSGRGKILKCSLNDYKEYKLFTTAHQQPLPSRLFHITHAVRVATENSN